MSNSYNQLPQVAFSILLALSLKPRHGYEIMQQVAEDSDGKIKLSPSSLYGSIKQLRDNNLIEEFDNGDTRRRYYKLTNTGLRKLSSEIEYYQASVTIARQRQVLEFGQHV